MLKVPICTVVFDEYNTLTQYIELAFDALIIYGNLATLAFKIIINLF